VWPAGSVGAGSRPRALDYQLVEVFGQGEVPEPMPAQVSKCHPLGQGALHEHTGGRRDQDLPAVARLGDPGRPVHVQAQVIVPAQDPLAGVQAHPTRRGPSIGHWWAARARWAATAASTALAGLGKATKKESPSVLTSTPPSSIASRRIAA
jgi:hypothetical protein